MACQNLDKLKTFYDFQKKKTMKMSTQREMKMTMMWIAAMKIVKKRMKMRMMTI